MNKEQRNQLLMCAWFIASIVSVSAYIMHIVSGKGYEPAYLALALIFISWAIRRKKNKSEF